MEADSLRELGLLSHNYQNDYAAARTYHEQALRLYRELGDRMGEGRVLDAFGLACYGQGDYAAGMSYHEQGLHLCRETGNRFDEGYALLGLGHGSLLLGAPDRARAHYERALCLCREIGERSARPARELALLGLGTSFHTLGDYDRARAYYGRALRTELQMVSRRGTGQAWLGLLFHHLGDDEAARSHAQRAVLSTQDTGCRGPRAQALTVLGHALAGLGQWAEAAGAYRRALALRRDLGQSHLIPEPLAGLARVAEACGDRTGALAHVEEILACLETYPELYGTDEPLRVYLTCYRVLRAGEDPRAAEILDAAYRLLQERAARIEDERLCRSFLENVAANREVVAAWEERSHA
jgi:tetratricopeptide (TPR) repeat protein